MSEYVIEVEYDTLNGTFSQKRREEIVRCRDCGRYMPPSKENGWNDRCAMVDGFTVTPDGFCAWGERRSDDRD